MLGLTSVLMVANNLLECFFQIFALFYGVELAPAIDGGRATYRPVLVLQLNAIVPNQMRNLQSCHHSHKVMYWLEVLAFHYFR